MAEKLKMLMDIFGKVTFGVLIAAAVFISVFGGFDAQISVKDTLADIGSFCGVFSSGSYV